MTTLVVSRDANAFKFVSPTNNRIGPFQQSKFVELVLDKEGKITRIEYVTQTEQIYTQPVECLEELPSVSALHEHAWFGFYKNDCRLNAKGEIVPLYKYTFHPDGSMHEKVKYRTA